MSIGTKLMLSFFCIAALIASQTAVSVWQSYAPLRDLGECPAGPADGSAQSAETQQVLHRELVAAAVRTSRIRMVAIGSAAMVIALAAGLVLPRLFTKPIRRLQRAAVAFAEGDLSWRVDGCGEGEFGTLARTLNKMAGNLQQANEALVVVNRTMEGRVEERAAELDQAHERLRQAQFELVQREKMSMLGQLAAGVAHEVNTPTAAIINASVDAEENLREFLALTVAPDDLPTETRKWLAGMFAALFGDDRQRSETTVRNERRQVQRRLREAGYSESRRMAEVIVAYRISETADDENLLNRISQERILSVLEHALALKVSAEISGASARKVARIVRSLRFYAHDSRGEVSDVDINESIENTLVIMKNRLKRIARVQTSLQEDMPAVQCGADLLQVWTNILSNACDAIGDSGVEGETALIEVSSRREGETVVVEISNEGPPIPDEIMAKMFDPFFTTKRVGRGTGLGLSICTSILQRWGGVICARNGEGRVTFEVRLPIEAAGRDGKDADPVAAAAS